jgi:hypothetical protein
MTRKNLGISPTPFGTSFLKQYEILSQRQDVLLDMLESANTPPRQDLLARHISAVKMQRRSVAEVQLANWVLENPEHKKAIAGVMGWER